MFQNQLTTHRLDRLQLIQYSLGDVKFDHQDFKKNKNLKDVLEFFKEAHHKNKIPENIDENLKKGYELVNIERLKKEQPELLEEAFKVYYGGDEHDAAVARKAKQEGKLEGKLEGKAEGKAELLVSIINSLIQDNFSDELICKYANITIAELVKFKNDIKNNKYINTEEVVENKNKLSSKIIKNRKPGKQQSSK